MPRLAVLLCLLGVVAAACTSSSTGPGQPAVAATPHVTGAQPAAAPAPTQPAEPAATPASPAPGRPSAAARTRATSSAPAGLPTVRDIPLPGNTSRWDYQGLILRRIGSTSAHHGDGTVSVYDPVPAPWWAGSGMCPASTA
jgi:hypothetical protein